MMMAMTYVPGFSLYPSSYAQYVPHETMQIYVFWAMYKCTFLKYRVALFGMLSPFVSKMII